MMATTHVFVGLVLAAAVTATTPEYAVPAAIAAIVGGLFPDLDVCARHRKTLHFPVYYWVLALPVSLVAFFVPTTATVAVAVFLLSAAAHALSDHVGGGLAARPWEGSSRRAVYSHYHGRWLEPRRWVAYDGSPGDLALAGILAVPALFVFEGSIHSLVVTMLVVSIGYAVFRRYFAGVGERVLEDSRSRRPDE
ncbi:hypothetical protein [Natronobacterium gregoryi]|uniref:Metal-dependent hydrolase n=2 Tax=Natronobacterium gregoryi TaxID=44930 RepID=L0AGM3_NATGS|nr:hypothetical protein [Natronobacterium gregoryi]AFZ72302.1 hypothetical protein Natgr_1072 [Natronobacterium gregoryi SP2]ELY62423.1 hypothetical protein C490_18098 [Natronobacterium gregoryi SP2]PLK18477.1 hypothetical protein CYV19_17760 [Natronobacterium gregoryi SP2]SFJ69999.1 hypothetical protein SAMN05443661_16012 [Natronobacterium gregoryi]